MTKNSGIGYGAYRFVKVLQRDVLRKCAIAVLGPHGFDADTTFVDWITAFQQIRNLSAKAESECIWSAPSHPEDKPADWQAFMLALERERERLTKSGSDEPEHN
jgi:hypothetical protein